MTLSEVEAKTKLEQQREVFRQRHGHRESFAIIEEFISDYCTTKGNTTTTRLKYYTLFNVILRASGKGLESQDGDSIRQLIAKIKDDHLKASTKETTIKALKTFYQWYKRRHREWFNTNYELKGAVEYLLEDYVYRKPKNEHTRSSYVTEEDVAKILEACYSIRQKVLFSVLWASGCRWGELESLQVRDVEPMKHGYLLRLRESKTVTRPIPLIDEPPIHVNKFLNIYLTGHPLKDNPRAPLFLNHRGEPLRYQAARKWLEELQELAGMTDKDIHFHAFRKGRATYLAAKGWANAQLSQMFGWSMSSSMPGVYIRRSGVDLIGKMAETAGVQEAREEEKTRYLECGGCSSMNVPGARFCTLCGRPLGPGAVLALERLALERVEEKHPDLVAQVAERMLASIGEKKGL